jgi:two-component system, NarL family, response regulator LiaR
MNVENSAIISPKQDRGEISILIADDHPLLRKALRDVLGKQQDLRIVSEAEDGEMAIELADRLLPDVIIMDIAMPKLNGLEATRQIKAKHPNIAILVLTVHDDSEHILSILDAGAAGYLTKRVFGEDIIAAIRLIVAGESVLTAPVLRQVLKHTIKFPTKLPKRPEHDLLTNRELDILKMAAQGISNKDIATRLNLSLRTIKGYMVEIFSKLNVGTRTEAVIKGLRSGLLNINDINEDNNS